MFGHSAFSEAPFAAGAGASLTATLAATEAPDTCSIAATLIAGTIAPAQPDTLFGGSARQRRQQRRQLLRRVPAHLTARLAATEAPDTCALRGYLTHRARMAAREAPDTVRMAADLDIYAQAKRQDEDWLLFA